MMEVFYLIAFVLISYALGRKILMFFKFNFSSFSENFIFSTALALGIFAYFTFFLGLLGLLYKEVFYILLFLIFVLVFRDIKYFLVFIFKSLRGVKLKLNFNIFSVLAAFIVFIVFMNVLASLAPPFGIDVIAYHLAVPKMYMQANKIFHIPFSFHSDSPFMINMLYLMAMIIKSDILAQLIAYFISVLLALSVYAFSTRFFNKKIAIISAFIIYTIPMIIEYATQAYVDIGFAFFSFMAFYSFLLWSLKLEKKWIVMCALMLGFSVSTKLPGIFNIFILSLFVFYTLLTNTLTKKVQKKHAVESLVLFGVIVLLVGSLWYIKSYLYTGNPVFPYLYNIFGGKNWDLQTDIFFKTIRYPVFANFTLHGFADFLLLPWNITMHSLKFHAFLGLSPMFLAFVPLYFFIKKNRIINQMLLFSISYITLWYFIIYPDLRYFSIYSLLAITSAYVINMLLEKRFFYYPIFVLFVSYIIFSSALWYGTNFKQLPYAFGLESEQEFYDKLNYETLYEHCNFVNKIPGSKVLLFNELFGGYFCKDYVRGDIKMSNAYIGYSKCNNTHDLRYALKSLNITHIFYADSPAPALTSGEYLRIWNMMKDLLANYSVKIYEKKGVAIYELK